MTATYKLNSYQQSIKNLIEAGGLSGKIVLSLKNVAFPTSDQSKCEDYE